MIFTCPVRCHRCVLVLVALRQQSDHFTSANWMGFRIPLVKTVVSCRLSLYAPVIKHGLLEHTPFSSVILIFKPLFIGDVP